MKEEAERLHHLGFAIHWVRPKSKWPVKAGWTKGPRASLSDLLKEYQDGYNLGVRLGSPSVLKTKFGDEKKIREGFLGVIDCDVKSCDPKHRDQMEKKLWGLFPGLPKNPSRVITGRGNGSQHIYLVSPKPVSPKRLAQSADTVKVRLPSVKPSRKEKETLSKKDLEAGWRLRPAWEIALMGEGQQCVLPPSTHPDTGKLYLWGGGHEMFQLLNPPTGGVEKIEKEKPKGIFKPVKISSAKFNKLPEELRAKITEGVGVEDRSASLFGVVLSLLKEGFTEEEILTLLTDTENFLGQTAYDHAKTTSRTTAAQWLKTYTFKKAKRESMDISAFEREVIEIPLTKESAEKQAKEIAPVKWTDFLERGGPMGSGAPKKTMRNIILILKNELGKEPLIQHNAFSNRDTVTRDTPWAKKGEAVTDYTILSIKDWLGEKFGFEPPTTLISEAVHFLARKNSFHPVRDYLNALEWDEKERLDDWLITYLEASEKPEYLRIIGPKILMGAVARVLVPGIKFDTVPILGGDQGVGKSRTACILAGDDWFCDALPDIRDKDARLNLLGNWIVELSELVSMKRSDSETLKSFMSARVDRVRAPYGKHWEEFKRQNIFIGTTNADEYLKDRTGDRRFWPVSVRHCHTKKLIRDRDQLFAEAKFRFESLGERIWLTKEEEEICNEVRAVKTVYGIEDEMLEAMTEYFKTPGENKISKDRFRLPDLFGDFGPLSGWGGHPYRFGMAAIIVKKLGYSKCIIRGKSYWKKEVFPPPTPTPKLKR